MRSTALKILLVLGAVLAFGWFAREDGKDVATLKCAGEHSSELLRIQGERDEIQAKLNSTAKAWAEDQARSKSIASGTVDRLAQSDVRLRVKLADATIEAVQGYNRGKSDGRAELHRETSEALIGITQDADRHVKALQESLKEVTQ
ncbi:endopeptidase [Pseudomonas phage 22PfluR64PP]|uniref:Endopeptidase n=1 Tax=Pseudomonas phage 22PfluR64PP TaxID=2163970 RepID=A0A2S1PDF6_9CAUD|nr:Rz-like spanin [Pseudomonas phage 22PfluR64PP]AWH14585.1 endopeptidase [Pseudomonas phage 22PfluR64PP]